MGPRGLVPLDQMLKAIGHPFRFELYKVAERLCLMEVPRPNPDFWS